MIRALTREQMVRVIEGMGAAGRVPVILDFWTHPEVFGEREPEVRELLSRYPSDVVFARIQVPQVFDAPPGDPAYRWVQSDDPYVGQRVGKDEQVAIHDWDLLDEVLAAFPSPEYPGLFPELMPEDGRYRLGYWWYWLFERHWSLRGMTRALFDFYDDPQSVHRLYRALTDFYLRMLERAKRELRLDGVFVSDDLGTQTGPFFSPEVFRTFFKPYYKELIDRAHELGMHFWLHACGNIERILPDLIEIGLDVLHPIQKYTMDERQIAKCYGKDLCIWAGFDVQRIIPYGTPEEVRQEVRYLIDTYARPEGRFMLTAGNAITPDCPVESLRALLDEAYTYGSLPRSNSKQSG
ncbi:MAG: hypothetical protein GX153_02540 [Clostridiaceae bacterium]|nr:hypothetical protein [Clostridiaceae bacterium]